MGVPALDRRCLARPGHRDRLRWRVVDVAELGHDHGHLDHRHGLTTLTYTNDIRPILATDCFSCHGQSVQQQGLNFTTYSGVLAALTPGSDTSLIVRVTQPGGLMYGMLSGDRNQKAGLIYDWVVNSKAAQ